MLMVSIRKAEPETITFLRMILTLNSVMPFGYREVSAVPDMVISFGRKVFSMCLRRNKSTAADLAAGRSISMRNPMGKAFWPWLRTASGQMEYIFWMSRKQRSPHSGS